MKKLIIAASLTLWFFNQTVSVNATSTVISLPSDIDNFPIYKSTAGTGEVECYTGNNRSNQWIIQQWNNDQSLCLDPSNQPVDSDCAGADFAKETATERACYWKNQRKVRLEVNSNAMQYHGCCIACKPESRLNPGGYSAYLMTNLGERPNYANEKFMDISTLDHLVLSTDYSTDSYSEGECSSTDPVDPLVGRTKAGFSYMNLILSMLDKTTGAYQGTIFYQTSLFDNRSDWQTGQSEYKNCGFPTSVTSKPWLVFTFPINRFGQNMALPGQGTKHYQWDILSDLKQQISDCGYADRYQIKLGAMFIGNEMQNTLAMSNTFTDPKITLVSKDNPPIGYFEPSQSDCSIKGWTCDPDNFSKPLTVQFFEGSNLIGSTQANGVRESAVGDRCGGQSNRGFTFVLPNSVRDNQPHQFIVKANNIDITGSETGAAIDLILNGNNSLSCAPLATAPKCTSCAGANRGLGDANCDGVVNLTDFMIWKDEYLGFISNPIEKNNYLSDFDCDGKVTMNDFVKWKNGYLSK